MKRLSYVIELRIKINSIYEPVVCFVDNDLYIASNDAINCARKYFSNDDWQIRTVHSNICETYYNIFPADFLGN